MTFHHRAKAIALLVSAALAQWSVVDPARADSGVGVDTTLGNAMNPAPVNPSTAGAWMDEDGSGTRAPAARTPTGDYYNIPLSPVEAKDMKKSAGGWTYFGAAEIGAIGVGGDAKSQGFRTYKDLKSGPYVNNFGVSAEKPDAARFLEVVGGGVGTHDQFYGLQFGRYNDWKVNLFYNEGLHVFTTTYRSLWNGLGTGDLALKSLAPGGAATAAATQTNIQNALAATDNTELAMVRKKAGVRYDTNLSDTWKLYASYSDEKRTGSRPFGATFGGGGGGGNIEIPESINYDTHDFLAGLRFNDALSSFNLQASASLFRNNLDTMAFQDPLSITLNGSTGLAASSFQQGRYDLAPGNEHYSLKGEYARSLPDFYKGRFTATVALGSMRQNDNLIAPTMYPLTGGTVTAGGVSLANMWNTTAALSKQSADAKINTTLVDLGLSFKPVDALDVKGKVRYYETENSTSYWACNPLTGQWGRLLNEGSGLALATANITAGVNPAGTSANAYNAANCNLAAVQAMRLVPAAGNVNIRNVPFEYNQLNLGLSADYRLNRASSLNAALERETYHREFRERDNTWEDKFKIGYVNRGIIDGMLRLSYEHAQRRGSEYHADPYEPFYSASFGPLPTATGVAATSWIHNVEQFRKFDLADRNQNIVNARLNYQFKPGLDGAVNIQFKDATYPNTEVGRIDHQRQNSATFDLSYQASSTMTVYGFYSYQEARMAQKGIWANACAIGSTYYFYSNGQVLAAATGAAAPATPAGTTLVNTQNVSGTNWEHVCGTASATSPLYPESRAWNVESRDHNDVIGAGFKYDFGKAQLDLNYTYALGRTKIGYSYNAAALGMTAVQASLAGSSFSDLTFGQNILSASLLVPIDKRMSVRLLYRYEDGKFRDWHYDGVAANPVPATNAVYLDAGPQNYKVNLIGALLHIRM